MQIRTSRYLNPTPVSFAVNTSGACQLLGNFVGVKISSNNIIFYQSPSEWNYVLGT